MVPIFQMRKSKLGEVRPHSQKAAELRCGPQVSCAQARVLMVCTCVCASWLSKQLLFTSHTHCLEEAAWPAGQDAALTANRSLGHGWT